MLFCTLYLPCDRVRSNSLNNSIRCKLAHEGCSQRLRFGITVCRGIKVLDCIIIQSKVEELATGWYRRRCIGDGDSIFGYAILRHDIQHAVVESDSLSVRLLDKLNIRHFSLRKRIGLDSGGVLHTCSSYACQRYIVGLLLNKGNGVGFRFAALRRYDDSNRLVGLADGNRLQVAAMDSLYVIQALLTKAYRNLVVGDICIPAGNGHAVHLQV